MKWLVTGSGGYLGAHLISKLLRNELTFLPLVGKSLSSTNRLRYLGVKGEYVELSDFQTVRERFQEFKPDVVVHLASLKSPEESNRFPDLYLKNNLQILINVFATEACKSYNMVHCVIVQTNACTLDLNAPSSSEEVDIGNPLFYSF